MALHPFDEAIRLLARADGSFDGHTSVAYANMVGPFGGITTAQALQAVLQHPDRLGEPIALTVNFCAPVADGPFQVVAQPVRTNRSTQHWVIDLRQQGQTVMSGTAVTALRRETWGVDEEPMPVCPPPQQVAVPETQAPMEFVKRYEQRFVTGNLPLVWDGQESSSLTQLWVRDMPPRPLDFASLSAIADIFLPRVFVRRSTHVPVGTVSMTVYFHASSAQLVETGTGYLLGQAKAQAFRNGFFDQTSQLWNEAGALLVTTHQIVYFRQ
jgi:acyl-coenzyme A thioesterase PaaI-like protein